MSSPGQTNGASKRRDHKCRAVWKKYVADVGEHFEEQSASIIQAVDVSEAQSEVTVGGVPWIPSCDLSRAVPQRNSSPLADGKTTTDEKEMIILTMNERHYYCHRSVMCRSSYLDTLLSIRWLEGAWNPDEPIHLQLDEQMFLTALYTLYGWVPCPTGLDHIGVEALDWLAAVADFLDLSSLTQHISERLSLILLPEAMTTGRNGATLHLLPVEDLLGALPICLRLNLPQPMAQLTLINVVALWWRSPAAIDALMNLPEAIRRAMLDNLPKQPLEPRFLSWMEVFRRMDLTLDKTRDASRRGHERREFLTALRADLMVAFAKYLARPSAPILGIMASLRRSVWHMVCRVSWESAEEVCDEVIAQHCLGTTFLSAQEALIQGQEVPVDLLPEEIEGESVEEAAEHLRTETRDMVRRALRIHLPFLMQTDAWKAKSSDVRKSLLHEFNFFGTESNTRSSKPNLRPMRLIGTPSNSRALLNNFADKDKGIAHASDGANAARSEDTAVNARLVNTLSKQIMTSIKAKEAKSVDLSQVAKPPARTFVSTLDILPPLVWIESGIRDKTEHLKESFANR